MFGHIVGSFVPFYSSVRRDPLQRNTEMLLVKLVSNPTTVMEEVRFVRGDLVVLQS